MILYLYTNLRQKLLLKVWHAEVAQWVEAIVLHAEGWVLESHQRQTQILKTGSVSSTSKRSTIGVSVTSPWR